MCRASFTSFFYDSLLGRFLFLDGFEAQKSVLLILPDRVKSHQEKKFIFSVLEFDFFNPRETNVSSRVSAVLVLVKGLVERSGRRTQQQQQ